MRRDGRLKRYTIRAALSGLQVFCANTSAFAMTVRVLLGWNLACLTNPFEVFVCHCSAQLLSADKKQVRQLKMKRQLETTHGSTNAPKR